ncbi:hypothetical protein EYC58_01335 [Candidatus Saccharibacteria bacterium]|nr:MAG: hypothetical protein EYC58_01335 [Candidatus Saccharibacteria bacterium]
MKYSGILATFKPKLLNIVDIDTLANATVGANLLIYGEIHGIQENAHVIYTLAHRLGIQRIAVEASPSVREFIDAVRHNNYDFSLLDVDIFDASILSLEMIKTLTVLAQEGVVQEIAYIDTYFDDSEAIVGELSDSPQKREKELADNMLALDDSLKSLCMLGQWHTRPQPLEQNDGSMHVSALYRVRREKPDIPFIHNVYRAGKLYNAGRVIHLPYNPQLPDFYEIKKISQIDYTLSIPMAVKISLPVPER